MIDRKGCVGWSVHQLNCTVVSQRAHHDLCSGNFTSYELFSLKFPLQLSGLKDGTPDHLCLLKLAGDLKTTCGRLLTEESKVKARWAGYFGRLYQADPPAVELDVRGVTIPVAEPPMNCGPPSFVETQATVNRLKWGKAPGICGIHTELLKAGGNAALVSLHAVLCLLCLEHRHHPH